MKINVASPLIFGSDSYKPRLKERLKQLIDSLKSKDFYVEVNGTSILKNAGKNNFDLQYFLRIKFDWKFFLTFQTREYSEENKQVNLWRWIFILSTAHDSWFHLL